MKKLFVLFAFFLLNGLYAENLIPDFYYTYDEMVQEIFALQTQYPSIVKVESLGVVNNPFADTPLLHSQYVIYGVKVTRDVQEENEKPGVLFIGQVHAEELVGVHGTIAHIREICQRQNSSPFRYWLSGIETWFIPTLNPGGMDVVHYYDKTYRKTLCDTNNNGIFDYTMGSSPGWDIDGVDINRNCDWNWLHGDDYLYPGGEEVYDYFRGFTPFSENETMAFKKLMERKQFIYGIVWHGSRSERVKENVYWPYEFGGDETRRCPDYNIAQAIGNGLAGQLHKPNGGLFTSSASQGRNGGVTTWSYYFNGSFIVTIEGSFVQPTSESSLDTEVTKVKDAETWLLNRTVNGILGIECPMLTGHITDAVTGAPLAAELIVEQNYADYLLPRKSEPAYGRYYRPLFPGNYTLKIRKKGYEDLRIENVIVSPSSWTIRDFQLQPKALAHYTGRVKKDGILVDGRIVIEDVENDTINVVNGLCEFDAYVGAHKIIVTAQNAYPYIDTLRVEAGNYVVDFQLSEENYILGENFDGTCCSWNMVGPWATIPTASTGLALSDSSSWYAFYTRNCDYYVTYNASISACDFENPVLSFWEKVYTEPGFDIVSVECSTDENFSTYTTMYTNSGWHDYWRQVYIPLQQFTEPIYLRFRLVDSSPNNASDASIFLDPGWMIDNIRIVGGNSQLVDADDGIVPPAQCLLRQNYPNPFNPETRIAFNLPQGYKSARLQFFNIKGQLISNENITSEIAKQGYFIWRPKNTASGVYFYRLTVDGAVKDIKKALLIK